MRYVYIGQSLDGFIAGPDGDLNWLHEIAAPEGDDLGFAAFMSGIDALVMGRKTFEQVLAFNQWPYDKPVFVLSSKPGVIPDHLQGKAELLRGEPSQLVEDLRRRGFEKLYIDGGGVVQSFLRAGLIDEMTVTTMPILLGGGVPLFGELDGYVRFELVESEILLGALVKSRYRRIE